jgi:glycolate oxidase iron-sulfur subunit
VGRATVLVLSELGYEVIIPPDQVCCAAPIFLAGYPDEALRNIDRNLAVFGSVDADAIVVDCATCGSALKKGIPELLEDIGLDPSRAVSIAARVKDVSEIVSEDLDRLDLDDPGRHEPVDVTYHDPCHLVRGMGVSAQPRKLLSSLPGIRFVEMKGAGECCGGGGSFQFEHVELSSAVTSKKTGNIRATSARIVATGCPGCRLTIQGNLDRDSDPRVVHTMELLARSLRSGHTPGSRGRR